MFYKTIKYFLNRSIVYNLYLKIPIQMNFNGVQSFGLLPILRKPLHKLQTIDDEYFSKNKNTIPAQMHSFDWLSDFKNSGGINLLQKSRKLILNWHDCKFKLNSDAWEEVLIAKRIINLSINFEFYGLSANEEFKKIIINIIFFHFKHLIIINNLKVEKYDSDIEVSKSILLLCNHFKNKNYFNKIVKFIKKQVSHQINKDGFHKSINVNEQA